MTESEGYTAPLPPPPTCTSALCDLVATHRVFFRRAEYGPFCGDHAAQYLQDLRHHWAAYQEVMNS